MRKVMKIENYDNYYSANEFNCIAQAFAVAADYYNKGNYFYYALYFSYFSNWYVEAYESGKYINKVNYILEKMGLKAVSVSAKTDSELKKFFRTTIMNDYPIILVIRKKNLPYSLTEIDSAHGIIIAGFDENASCFLVKDSLHVEQSGAIYQGSGFGLFDLWLKESLITNMLYQQKLDTINKIDDTIFVIYREKEKVVNSINDVLVEIYTNYSFKKNKFIEYLTSSENILSLEDDVFCQDFRRKLLLSKKVLKDILVRGAIEVEYFNIVKFQEFLNEFEKKYTIITNYLTISSKRHKSLSDSKRAALIEELKVLDEKLEEFLKEIVSNAESGSMDTG